MFTCEGQTSALMATWANLANSDVVCQMNYARYQMAGICFLQFGPPKSHFKLQILPDALAAATSAQTAQAFSNSTFLIDSRCSHAISKFLLGSWPLTREIHMARDSGLTLFAGLHNAHKHGESIMTLPKLSIQRHFKRRPESSVKTHTLSKWS